MPRSSRDLDAGNDLKRIATLLGVCPQARIQTIVIRDGDHIQLAVASGVIKHCLHVGDAVTQRRVHVKIGTSETIHSRLMLLENEHISLRIMLKVEPSA